MTPIFQPDSSDELRPVADASDVKVFPKLGEIAQLCALKVYSHLGNYGIVAFFLLWLFFKYEVRALTILHLCNILFCAVFADITNRYLIYTLFPLIAMAIEDNTWIYRLRKAL